METRRFYLGRDYSEAIEACGAVPVHLSLIPKIEYISAAMADLDGILLPGSNTDIDPHYYGEEPHRELGTVIPEKDETDLIVIAEAERQKLPVLGICFGMQALNVARGGSLVQDIASQIEGSIKHEQGAPATRVSHSVEIEKDSFLAGLPAVIEAEGAIRVNSSHHQAVATVGENLKAIAWAKDGIIEALQDTRDGVAYGVQWHPELSHGTDRLSREIFEFFVSKCQKP